MSDKIPEWLRDLYLCYLGDSIWKRTLYIRKFVRDHNGQEFFDRYSTSTDSIADFLRRAKNKGLEI